MRKPKWLSIRLVVISVLLVGAVAWSQLSWYLGVAYPHTLPTNQYHPERSFVGFVRIPDDMDPYRGFVMLRARVESPNSIQITSLVPLRSATGRIRIVLEYWTRDGARQKQFQQHYSIACEPNGRYHDATELDEILLYDRNDQGEIQILATITLRTPTHLLPFVPQPPSQKPDEHPTSEPPSFGSRVTDLGTPHLFIRRGASLSMHGRMG